jgi:hypothetical protein
MRKYFLRSLLLIGVCFTVACNQNVVVPDSRDIPLPSGQEGQVIGQETVLELYTKFVGYSNAKGESLTRSQAETLMGGAILTPQADNIPSGLACRASTSVRSFFFSSNVYGRIQFDCAEIGGRFDSIGYASIRITAPNGSYADGFNIYGVGSQHAEVLGGPVARINGRYVIQGTLEANYSKPISSSVRLVYGLKTQPFEAINATW